MSKSLVIKFILIYVFFISIITSYFLYDYKLSKKNHLEQKAIEHSLLYEAIYEENRTVAKLIYDTQINIKKVVDIFKHAHNSDENKKKLIREELHKLLEFQYKKLKGYNLKQLHFHLPNNESFLRMHRPKKFGDDLSEIRPTVKYVNENQREIHSFEEGRIFNGFRYVFPLFDENKYHIGSIEISFSAMSLIEEVHASYNLHASFLIRKEIVDQKVFEEEKKNYIQSPNKDFYFEKTIYNNFPPISLKSGIKDLTNQMLKGEAFSIYLDEVNHIKSILPIRNTITKEVNAILCVCVEDDYLEKIQENLVNILSVSYILLALVLYLFYKQKQTNLKLKKLNSDLDKKISIELKRNRKKDISILNNAKMASIAEMLNNISHQWRQPLNLISTSASGLKIHKEVDTLDDRNFANLTDIILEQSSYLSKTLENFKDYLNDKKDEKVRFTIQKVMNKSLEMINETFKYTYIQIDKNFFEENLYISANESELIQVILNILNNGKEALAKNNPIEDRKLIVTIKEKNPKTGLITIEDNAGGVDLAIIDKIFDPYFTTKHESIGIGISLYMCYEIVTMNLKGKIYVKNKEKGAKFYIELPLIT